MTREEAKRLVKLWPLVEAHASEKIIQHKTLSGEWEDMECPRFDDDPSRYRIKPREFCLTRHRPSDTLHCWPSKEVAEKFINKYPGEYELITAREVQ